MNQPKTNRAFTLVELLAALAVLALLMVAVFGVFNQASKAWLLAENRTESFQGARMALDLMCRDLEGAMVGTHTNATGSLQPITKLTLATFETSQPPFSMGLSNLQETPPNTAIFFVTQNTDSPGTSNYIDLAECGYTICYASATGGGVQKGRYYLVRHFARSNDAAFDLFSNSTTPLVNTAWWSTNPSNKTPILDNALRFFVNYEYASPGGSNGTASSSRWDNPVQVVSEPTTTLPRAFHLRLSVLDRRYATRLAAQTALTQADLGYIPYNLGSVTQPMQQTIKEGLRTFYRSVYPRGGS